MDETTTPAAGDDLVDEPAGDDLAGDRWTQYQLLDEVMPAEVNPRRHSLGTLTRSIAAFGFVAPGAIDERTGRLVAGHGRLLALKAMRADESMDARARKAAAGDKRVKIPPGIVVYPSGRWAPSGIRLDGQGRWLAPVARGWASANDDEARAYLVTDNRQNELASWDTEGLLALLDQVGAADADLVAAAGYDAGDMDELRKLAEGEADAPETADALKDTQDKYVEQYGVLIVCDGPADQEDAYERVKGMGYNCKVVNT